MAANVTIYCLENITDYFEFERLCHDLMARQGYTKIEPLGGFSDKGRDALHTSQTGVETIFAYSVREDWRAKLAEDASKIHKHRHSCQELVFLTTARPSAGERDEAVAFIANQYGWKLELYGVERLRVQIDVHHPDLRALHPQIFPPQFYPAQSASVTQPVADHLLISAAPQDRAFADWLTKRLTAEGYRVWWEGLALLGGESYPDDIDTAIREHSYRVLGLYSQASLSDPEVMRQRTLALTVGRERKAEFLIPLNVDGVQPQQLDRVTSTLTFIPFQVNWATGLKQLLQKLEATGCPKPVLTGRSVAAGTFLEEDVLTGQSEVVFSNCLAVESVPIHIHRFEAQRDISYNAQQDVRLQWAFHTISPKVFLSFQEPDNATMNRYKLSRVDSVAWADEKKVFDVWTRDLIIELLRKALVVRCQEKGLHFCRQTGMQYFPTGLVPDERLRFTKPNGSKTFVQATGQRAYWRPQGSEEYRYALSPAFYTFRWPFDDFIATLRVRVRITDTAGNILPKRTGNSRRKHLCGDWWNAEWFSRLLAICQFLSDDGKIVIGRSIDEQIVLNAIPVNMTAPISINEAALNQQSFTRTDEMMRTRRDDEIEGEEEIEHE